MLVGSMLTVFGQADSKAEALLDQVSAKYDAYRTIQADFSLSAQQAQGETYEDKGVLFLNKPQQQFRIQLSIQDIISDGKSTWSVLKEDKEVQVSETEHNTERIGPNNLFTFYKKGFTYKSLADEPAAQGKLRVIELTPQDRSSYERIKLRINKKNHIHDVQIFDKSGASYTYTIHTLYVNHSIPRSKFTFNTSNYPDYEIVDLR